VVLEAMALDAPKPRATMQYIEGQWEKLLGVKVRTLFLESKDFYRAMNLGKYDLVLTGWMPDFPDPETSFAYFNSGNAPNPALWTDHYYDEVVASARMETDPVARISKYRSAERYLLTEEVTAIPLYNEAKILWKRDGISGVAYTESGGLDLRNASVLKGF
jgi:oligopeptide transport system substrate-binding protein